MIDANAEASRCREEAARAASALVELRQMLHESQEGEARATEDAKAEKVEMEELKLQLQDHGTRTDDSSAQFREEIERLTKRNKEIERRCERLHADLELEYFRTVETEGGDGRPARNASSSKFVNYVRPNSRYVSLSRKKLSARKKLS